MSKISRRRTTVEVSVIRNEHDPIFFNTTYGVTIRQDVDRGTEVLSVVARDADIAVSLGDKIERGIIE